MDNLRKAKDYRDEVCQPIMKNLVKLMLNIGHRKIMPYPFPCEIVQLLHLVYSHLKITDDQLDIQQRSTHAKETTVLSIKPMIFDNETVMHKEGGFMHSSLSPRLVRWFKSKLPFDVEIKPKKSKTGSVLFNITVKQEGGISDRDIKYITDPDDDGNYPIRITKKDSQMLKISPGLYMVSSRLET